MITIPLNPQKAAATIFDFNEGFKGDRMIGFIAENQIKEWYAFYNIMHPDFNKLDNLLKQDITKPSKYNSDGNYDAGYDMTSLIPIHNNDACQYYNGEIPIYNYDIKNKSCKDDKYLETGCWTIRMPFKGCPNYLFAATNIETKKIAIIGTMTYNEIIEKGSFYKQGERIKEFYGKPVYSNCDCYIITDKMIRKVII